MDLEHLGIDPAWLFHKGYKPAHETLKKRPIQMRLAQAWVKEPSLLAAFLNWEKAPWSNERNILAAVDESWFLRHWRDILRTSAGLRVAAAMAADDRKPISLRGITMIKKNIPG